jgi:flavin-dependent dehydrogenase
MPDAHANKTSGSTHFDTVIIGGGPGGSSIAALLAERGRAVLLIEKSRHPRFHIGESLLPFNLPLFERLGVAEEVRRISMPKYGVEFVSPDHEHTAVLAFADAWDKGHPSAYQVHRAAFDEILFRNAARKGAQILEGCRVIRVDFREGGATITARHDDGRVQAWETRFVVDASGRDTFLAEQLGIKRRDRRHGSAAIFGHFAGARRLPGREEGHISIFWFEHGWFWFIPLVDGATSVGAVCSPQYLRSRKVTPERFLFDTIALCPALAERLHDARLISPVTATGNYSYKATRTGGENYLMLGDAFQFIDPVFSTGVYIAMHSAFTAADTVETCLDRPREARAAMKAYDADMRRGPDIFSWFIYRVTAPGMRELFMEPRNDFRLREALLSLLSGDIFRDTPIRARVIAFKTLYYLTSLRYLRGSVAAWKNRRRAARDSRIAPAERRS